jgi:hypothetical protein
MIISLTALFSVPLASGDLDLIGQDWKLRRFQDGMLSELFRVIGVGVAPQDEAFVRNYQLEIADLPAQPALNVSFQLCSPVGRGEIDATIPRLYSHLRTSEVAVCPQTRCHFVAGTGLLAVSEEAFPEGGESGNGVFTVRTGQRALRTTCSATLPIKSRPNPVRPCVPITIKSDFVS